MTQALDEQVTGRLTAHPANFNTDLTYEPKKGRKLEKAAASLVSPPPVKKVTALVKPESFIKKKGGVRVLCLIDTNDY